MPVKLGAAKPEHIDLDEVAKEFPYGNVNITPVFGGLNVPAENGKDLMVIVNAAVLACFEE